MGLASKSGDMYLGMILKVWVWFGKTLNLMTLSHPSFKSLLLLCFLVSDSGNALTFSTPVKNGYLFILPKSPDFLWRHLSPKAFCS